MNYLKQTREEKGMTQAQLAEKSGVSRGTIINLELGKLASAQTTTLAKIADALDCSVTALFFSGK